MNLLADNLSHLMERNPVLHVVTAWVFAGVLLVVGWKLIRRNIAKYFAGEALPKAAVRFSLIVFAGGVISLLIAITISFFAPRIRF